MSDTFDLAAYLERIGLGRDEAGLRADLVAALPLVMAAHMRSIAFENLDVVLQKTISMDIGAIQAKLVRGGRGGYCFEQNTLLRHALAALGFTVAPLLCRVRWGKRADEETTFTHMALQVSLGDEEGNAGPWLADVGFAGTNSIAPVLLGTPEPQSLPEGTFRIVDGAAGFELLQMQSRTDPEQWMGLYTWRSGETASDPDLELSNWWSCTKPGARFTGQFFVARTIGTSGEKRHILNDSYVVRNAGGQATTAPITSREQLLSLLAEVFGLTLPADTDGLGRYLPGSNM